MTVLGQIRPALWGRAAVIALTAALAGCHADRQITGSVPESHETRHPIVVTQSAFTLDLPVGQGRGGLNERQRREVAVFAASWAKAGRGMLTIELPHGGATDRVSAFVEPEIRSLLVASGVKPGAIAVRRYAATGPAHLAPVRLSYPKLTAKVPHPCGIWPDDLGAGGGDWDGVVGNREYYNFGCASQQNLAAMVADPEDLLRPRPADPPFAPRRHTVLDKYTKGESPATVYPEDSEARVSEVGQ